MANKINYWQGLSERITDPKQTKNKRPDTSDLEIEFITKYFNKEDDILDIGSGSGLIVNKLIDHVKSIIAVEKFEGFSKFISDNPNILVVNAGLEGFRIRKEFDGILSTGVSQCFGKEDIIPMYENIYEMLKTGQYFIMRMQCGLKEDVIVNGYSEELKTDYFASYRQLDSEIELLKSTGFKEVEIFDIFPDSLNVWDNTRHFIFVCKK